MFYAWYTVIRSSKTKTADYIESDVPRPKNTRTIFEKARKSKGFNPKQREWLWSKWPNRKGIISVLVYGTPSHAWILAFHSRLSLLVPYHVWLWPVHWKIFLDFVLWGWNVWIEHGEKGNLSGCPRETFGQSVSIPKLDRYEPRPKIEKGARGQKS